MSFAWLQAQAQPAWELGTEVPKESGNDYELESGATVHLEVVDKQFYAVFLDEERRVVEPPIPKLILRGEEARNKTNNFVLSLTRGDGPYLTHARHYHPPHDYWLILVVPQEDGESEVLPRGRFTQ